jgi:outer membrane immunogenic protein
MLRRALLCAAVSVGPVAGAAAADLPNRYRGPDLFSPAPAATWTGLYVGAQVGYGFGSDQTLVNVSGFPFSFVGPDHDLSGPVGGIHAGFNFQNGPIVYGLEGDLELANADGTISLAGSGGFAGLGLTSRTSIDWQGSLRGRLGFAMFERAMIYGTAGLAFANIENAYSATLPPGNVFGAPAGITAAKFDETHWGWTVGAGVEYALMSNWTARVEYRYTNFSEYKNNSTLLTAAGSTSRQDPDLHTFRIGGSYRF